MKKSASKRKTANFTFFKKKGSKEHADNNFKLPSINFLEKNSDPKNRKNIDDSELS